VREILHTLPQAAQAAILDDLEGTHKYRVHEFADEPAHHGAPQAAADDFPTASIPRAGEQ
jgi:phospholipid/cholesterol/gamma-HCH transport system ATP-binding protein